MVNVNKRKVYSLMVNVLAGKETCLETADHIYLETRDWTLEEQHYLHCIMLQAHQSMIWAQMRKFLEEEKK